MNAFGWGGCCKVRGEGLKGGRGNRRGGGDIFFLSLLSFFFFGGEKSNDTQPK
jgi:hypothetical protein